MCPSIIRCFTEWEKNEGRREKKKRKTRITEVLLNLGKHTCKAMWITDFSFPYPLMGWYRGGWRLRRGHKVLKSTVTVRNVSLSNERELLAESRSGLFLNWSNNLKPKYNPPWKVAKVIPLLPPSTSLPPLTAKHLDEQTVTVVDVNSPLSL